MAAACFQAAMNIYVVILPSTLRFSDFLVPFQSCDKPDSHLSGRFPENSSGSSLDGSHYVMTDIRTEWSVYPKSFFRFGKPTCNGSYLWLAATYEFALLKFSEKYSDALLETACKKTLSYTSSPSYKSIKNILVTGSVKPESETAESKTTHKAHGITRGADYFGGKHIWQIRVQ